VLSDLDRRATVLRRGLAAALAMTLAPLLLPVLANAAAPEAEAVPPPALNALPPPMAVRPGVPVNPGEMRRQARMANELYRSTSADDLLDALLVAQPVIRLGVCLQRHRL